MDYDKCLHKISVVSAYPGLKHVSSLHVHLALAVLTNTAGPN